MPVELTETMFESPLTERLAHSSLSSLSLYWLGQAGFVIRSSDLQIVIDPYLSDSLAEKYRGKPLPHVRMMPAPIRPTELGPDLVLCTHHHTDHMDPQTLEPIGRDPNVRFVVPMASLDEAQRRTAVAGSRLIAMDAGQSIEPSPGLRITAVRAAHETLDTDAAGHHRFLGYIIETDGVRIYHSGDSVPFEGQTEEIARPRPHLALLPVNGRSEWLRRHNVPGNYTLEEAVALSAACGIPAMIAHHYGMFDFNTLAPEIIDECSGAPRLPIRLCRARFQVEYGLRVT